MRRGLVGDNVRGDAARDQLGKDVGGVGDEAHREGFLGLERVIDQGHCLFEVVDHGIDIARGQAALRAGRIHLHHQGHALVHSHRQRLSSAHSSQASSEHELALQAGLKVLLRGRSEGLVGALEDALGADVDPASGGHLAVHHQTLGVELVKVLLCGPLAHQVRVGDEHARGVGIGAKDAHRLARLHQQGLVVGQVLQRRDDGIEAGPVARGLAPPAIDDQLVGLFGHLRVEVVHQHTHGRFLLPAPAGDLSASRRADDTFGHSSPPQCGLARHYTASW